MTSRAKRFLSSRRNCIGSKSCIIMKEQTTYVIISASFTRLRPRDFISDVSSHGRVAYHPASPFASSHFWELVLVRFRTVLIKSQLLCANVICCCNLVCDCALENFSASCTQKDCLLYGGFRTFLGQVSYPAHASIALVPAG